MLEPSAVRLKAHWVYLTNRLHHLRYKEFDVTLQAMQWVLYSAPVKDATALLVLFGLSEHAHSDGRNAFPSRETLARYARCSVRTVATKLKVLEDAGVIKRGDQQLVSHVRADRRPVVYDLNYDVQLLHPVGSGYDDEQFPAPRKDSEEPNDVQSGVERGEAERKNDMQIPAHKPKEEPITKEKEFVGEVPQQEGMDAPIPIHRPRRQPPSRKKWKPSEIAWNTAVNEYIKYLKVPDLHDLVLRYELWCHSKKRAMSDPEWLTWVLRDEKVAREAHEAKQAKAKKRPPWHAVAE